MNPPRVLRAQRVVSTVVKDDRPEFAGRTISDPTALLMGLVDFMSTRATEIFVTLYVNVRNGLIGFTEFGEGSPIGVSVNPQGIFAGALNVNAAAIITVHQHPTGDATPSDDDFRLWTRLKDAGRLIGVPVLDNFVVTATHYYSESEGFVAKLPAAVIEHQRRKTAAPASRAAE